MKSSGPGGAAIIDLVLDHDGRTPLYRQIVDRVWLDVIEGTLESGTRLPTVRQLAVHLGVHLDTVVRAYQQLEHLGVVHSRRGAGTFIGIHASQQAEIERQKRIEEICLAAIEDGDAVGATVADLIEVMREMRPDPKRKELI
jgi:DNA-binding transcriptional regulator YhcF (GntR family)